MAVVVCLVLVSVACQTVSAQTAGGSGNAIRVSPVRTDLVINPGDTRQLTVSVTNLTSSQAEYQAIINDFVAANGENGEPALILDADKFAPSHSLKRFIAPISNVVVGAGQTKEIKVTITVPKTAAGGGYFGAVRFASAGGNDPTKNVTLAASVGSLVLVKVPGDVVESVKLESIDVRSGKDAANGNSVFTSNKNLYAVARFKNTGNVHEQPFGKIIVKKGSKLLQTTEINNTDPKGNVLPDSVRRFSIKLDKIGTFGKYTVEGNFGYGTNGQLLSGKTSFFVVPVVLIVVALVVLALLILAAVGLPKMIKRYNAGVVRRANRR